MEGEEEGEGGRGDDIQGGDMKAKSKVDEKNKCSMEERNKKKQKKNIIDSKVICGGNIG